MKKLLLKLAGKDNFELDKNISFWDIFRISRKYSFMLIRGFFKSLFHKRISSKIFVGRRVKFIKKNKITIGKNCKINNNVTLDALSKNGICLGNNVVIGKNTDIECTGSLTNLGEGIFIGSNTSFGAYCYFGCAGGINIGNDVIAGQNVRFHSENHNYKDLNKLIKEQGVTHKGIVVGNNCWIGAGAVFLDGAEIGDGCVVAANAVVTKKFPNNSIIAGIPAKIIGDRSNEN